MRATRINLIPKRVLVIGAGPAPDAIHLPVLARLRDRDEIVLALVCDIQRDRAAAARRKFGFLEDCGDAVAALERADIDVVYVFGSAQMHHEYGMRALQSGKHLFVEKPVAPTYLQACQLAELARAKGLIAVGGLNRRFTKALSAVRDRAGDAGWRFAEVAFHKPEFGKAASFGARSWLSANGIHGLDALLHVMGGLPERISANAGEAAAKQPGAFSALLRWRNGAQGVFLCNNNAGSRREEYVFHAPDETCTVSAAGLTIEKKGHPSRSLRLPMQGDGYAAEHQAFLEAIGGGVDPMHSIAAVAPSLFVAELIESGFTGAVRLPFPERRTLARSEPSAVGSVLVIQPVELLTALAELLPRHRIVSLQDVRDSSAERPDIVAAILGRGSAPLPADVLAKLPRLAIVGIVALSVARHEPEVLLARGVRLVNGSAAYADSVAEFALGLAILGRRRAFLSNDVMRADGWGTVPRARGLRGALVRGARAIRPAFDAMGLEKVIPMLRTVAAPLVGSAAQKASRPRDLQGATVGLIGWGANARSFAERLRPSRVRVIVFSEHAVPQDILEAGAVPVSFAEALAADVVSLHRGLTEETRHCLGEQELARLRPGSVLINVARGGLVEPNALMARLKQGDIFACLDTYDEEPLAASHPLRKLPNVFLTAHIAGGSPDNYAAAAFEVVRKVAAHLSGVEVESISSQRLRTMS